MHMVCSLDTGFGVIISDFRNIPIVGSRISQEWRKQMHWWFLTLDNRIICFIFCYEEKKSQNQ